MKFRHGNRLADHPELAAKQDGVSGATLRRQALAGAAWTAAERWLVRLAGLGTFIVLGRVLDPESFGTAALAISVIALVQVVADLGFSMWVLQARTVDQRMLSTTFWTSLGLGTLGAAVLGGVSFLLADLMNQPRLGPVLALLSVSLVLAGAASTPTALLSRDMRFKDLAVRQVTSILVGSFVGILSALLGAGVYSLVLQQLVQQFVAVSVLFRIAKWQPTFEFDPNVARQAVRFGFRVTGIQALQQSRDQGETLIIGLILGPVALGYWAVASRLLSTFLDVTLSVVSTVAAPVFLRLRDEPERMTRALRSSLLASSLLVGPALIGLALASPALIPVVFGERWEPSSQLAIALALGGVATSVSFFDRSVWLASERLDVELKLVAVIVLLHLTVVASVSQFGLLALAVAVALRALITMPMRIFAMHRVLDVSFRVYIQPATILASVLLAGGVAALFARQVFNNFDELATLSCTLITYAFLAALLVFVVARNEVALLVASILNRSKDPGFEIAAAAAADPI